MYIHNTPNIFIIYKKLQALGKQKDCKLVGKWERSIINHMYWCIASTPDGNGEVVKAKWLSLDNHVHNTHSGHRDCSQCVLMGNFKDRIEAKNGLRGVIQ